MDLLSLILAGLLDFAISINAARTNRARSRYPSHISSSNTKVINSSNKAVRISYSKDISYYISRARTGDEDLL
jgi:hypothetical protein